MENMEIRKDTEQLLADVSRKVNTYNFQNVPGFNIVSISMEKYKYAKIEYVIKELKRRNLHAYVKKEHPAWPPCKCGDNNDPCHEFLTVRGP